MMDTATVYVKHYSRDDARLSSVNRRELWRYAGFPGGPARPQGTETSAPACPEHTQGADASALGGLAAGTDPAPASSGSEPLEALLEDVLQECRGIFRYDVCWIRFPLTWNGSDPVLPFPARSRSLSKCLSGSREAVMMAATVGLELDRRIARSERFSPSKALLMQALGAERVEALCDTFCSDFRAQVCSEGKTITRRFSPGYGDLPLETQTDFFRLLDCSRQIGVSLNTSLLMSPSKSVTAIFGIRPMPESGMKQAGPAVSGSGAEADHRSCEGCTLEDCAYSRRNE